MTTPSRFLIVLALLTAPTAALAQSVAAPTAQPLTPSGDPDLQGIWDYRTMTPLQRPRDLADKDVFTAEEAAAYTQAQIDSRADYDALPTVHAKFWLDYGTALTADRRTSLVVDPPDGRVPVQTEDARARGRARAEKRERTHSIQDRSITERCIIGFNAGPPMNPGAYNNNLMLLQIPGMVVLHNEMVHEVRVIRWTAVTTCRTASGSCGVTRGGIGRGERWWWKRPISPTARTSWARAKTCGSLSASPEPTTLPCSTSTRSRPGLVRSTVDGGAPDDQNRRPDVRVRLSRGELRTDQHLVRGAGRGKTKRPPARHG